MRYDPKKIEQKWQKKWRTDKTYEPSFAKASAGKPDLKRAKKPFYNLMMFPYPSAEGLHIGGMRTFTGVDIYGRLKRMQGYDVFEPIGLDAFGIHSENYAIKTGRHPMKQAPVLEKNFYRQLGMMGNGFAWNERLETSDPEYYTWTQWIFVQMFKHGLAYRKKQPVNWCPSCKTVLADEQVIAGACERCGTVVVKKDLEQWFFRITAYADRLLGNLSKIDWSERVKIAQKNWIGKSEGAMIKFQISPRHSDPSADGEESQKKRDPLVVTLPQDDRIKYIEVFTTRPDTLFGATYLVLAPEHEFIEKHKTRIANYNEVAAYSKKARAKSEADRIAAGKEKTGVEVKGIKAINPASREEIPVFVADYVLGGYGTGAIMAVPGHDERDFEFAKKYRIPVRQVIESVFIQTTEPGIVREDLPFDHRDAIIAIVKHWSEEKYIGLKWKTVAWQTLVTGGIEKGQTAEEAAKAEIREETGFLHPKLVKDLGMIHGKWYHVPKKVNRFGHARGLYFELQDGACEAVSEEEQKNHDILWFSKEDLMKFLSPESHRWALALLEGERAYTGSGILADSGEFTGMDSEEAKWQITKFAGGKRVSQYHLRDWLLSRQRYWGPPIPMIFCDACAAGQRGERKEMPGWYSVPEKNLPVKLPFVRNFRPTGSDQSPLAAVPKFYKVRCPGCKKWARRETDVSDTFLDSAWYFLRYPSACSTRSRHVPWDSAITKKWLPVSMYIGGAEHSVLHLLYARFLTMAFYDWKLLNFDEPFPKFRAHGLITKDGAKMSKSKGNVVNPDEYVRAYGADAVRMYLAFMAPFEQDGDFRDAGIRGMTRFLERVWKLTGNVILIRRLAEKNLKSSFGRRPQDDALQRILHKTIKKVGEDIESLQYNTAISSLMILLNEFETHPDAMAKDGLEIFLKLLAPFAPHIAEELWQAGDWRPGAGDRKFKSIHREVWPKYNPRLIKEDTFDLVVQVNGKTRSAITVNKGISEQEATAAAKKLDAVARHLGAHVRRIIFVPDKLINFVV